MKDDEEQINILVHIKEVIYIDEKLTMHNHTGIIKVKYYIVATGLKESPVIENFTVDASLCLHHSMLANVFEREG